MKVVYTSKHGKKLQCTAIVTTNMCKNYVAGTMDMKVFKQYTKYLAIT